MKSPPKLSSSLFDPEELADLVNNELLIPRPTNRLPRGGRPVRTLHGEVIDAEGKPISGAYVAMAYPNGSHGSSYLDNYDKTDELGRFVVADFDFRTTIVVSRGPGWHWRGQIDPDQTTLQVTWPANGSVQVTIPPQIEGAQQGVHLELVHSTAGVGAERFWSATPDADGIAAFDDVLPGEFRIFATPAIKQRDGKSVRAEREIGRFMLSPGEAKQVSIDMATRVAVSGDAGPDAEYVTIEHVPTCRSEATGSVDCMLVEDDGRFAASVPGPGVYRFTIVRRPVVIVNGRPQGREQRFVVDATTRQVSVPLEDNRTPTAAFVQNSLDDPMYYAGNASYSMTDVKVAGIIGYHDQAGLVRELLRILNDPNSPQSWEYVAFDALGKMIKTPGVVEGLLELLQRDDAKPIRGRVIDALSDANAELPRIVKEVSSFAQDEDRLVRWNAQYCLGRIAFKHPELRNQLAPMFIMGLTDSFDRTRESAAAMLGSHQCEAALPALQPLLSDRNIHVRLAAAKAIWKISGDAEPLVTLASGILQHDDEDYELKRDAANALRGVPNLPTRTIGALMGYARNAPSADHRDHSKTAHHWLGETCQQVLDDYVTAEATK